MLDNDNIHLTAKRIRQVHDMKSAMNRQESKIPPTRTFADEIQQVLTMLTDPDTSVQHVFNRKNKIPSVIVYSPECMKSFKTNCFRCKKPSIVGIDRTFNLGKLFVTVTSYKHTGIINSKGRHPIVFGPFLIHGDSTCDVY